MGAGALLAGIATQMLLAIGWRAKMRRQRELAGSGAHREMLANALSELDSPDITTRLNAVRTMNALGGEYPALREEIRNLLRRHLQEKRSAYAGRALPSDLREISRSLRASAPGEVIWPWHKSL